MLLSLSVCNFPASRKSVVNIYSKEAADLQGWQIEFIHEEGCWVLNSKDVLRTLISSHSENVAPSSSMWTGSSCCWRSAPCNLITPICYVTAGQKNSPLFVFFSLFLLLYSFLYDYMGKVLFTNVVELVTMK